MQSSAAASALQQQRLASAAAASWRPASRRAPAAPARAYYQQPASSGAKRAGSAAGTEDVSDIIHLAKRRLTTRAAEPAGPFGDFMRKVNLAWRIFFPEPEKVMTPKEEGKQRLRMILVADRCAQCGLGGWQAGGRRVGSSSFWVLRLLTAPGGRSGARGAAPRNLHSLAQPKGPAIPCPARLFSEHLF
jgi:hypothetical protein